MKDVEERLRHLEEEVARLRGLLEAGRGPGPAAPPARSPATPPAAAPAPPPTPHAPAAWGPPPAYAPAAAPGFPPPGMPGPPPASPAAPSQPIPPQPAPHAAPPGASGWLPGPPLPEPGPREALESRIGREWLPRVGIAVFVLGFVFFLKLAFDNGWVPLWSHPVVGVVLGGALWGLGDFLLARRRGSYPQVLAAGGAVLVAFSVFAAHHLPDYRAATGMPLLLDSVLLGAVVALLVGYAWLRDLPALAAVAAVLGPLTAVAADLWGSFSIAYLLAVVVALLALAIWKRWAVVPAVAMPAAFAALLAGALRGAPPTAILVGNLALAAAFLAASLRPGASWARPATAPAAAAVWLVLILAGAPGLPAVAGLAVLVAATLALAWRGGETESALPSLLALAAVAVLAMFLGADAPLSLALAGVVLAGGVALGLAGRDETGPAASLGFGVLVGLVAFAKGASAWLALPVLGVLVLGALGVAWLRGRRILAAAATGAGAVALLVLLALDAPPAGILLLLAPILAAELALGRRQDADATTTATQAAALVFGAVVALVATGLADFPWPAALATHLPGAWQGLTLLALAGVGIGMAAAGGPLLHRWAWGLVGLALLVLWPPVQADGGAVVVGWVLVCGAAVLAAFRRRRLLLARVSAVPATLAGLHLFMIESQTAVRYGADPVAALGDAALFLLGAAALVAVTLVLRASGDRREEHWATLGAAAALPLVHLGTALPAGAVTLAWGTYGGLLLLLGFLLRDAPVRVTALGTFALVLLRLFLVDLRAVEPVWRILVFLGVGAILLLVSYAYVRSRRHDAAQGAHGTHGPPTAPGPWGPPGPVVPGPAAPGPAAPGPAAPGHAAPDPAAQGAPPPGPASPPAPPAAPRWQPPPSPQGPPPRPPQNAPQNAPPGSPARRPPERPPGSA